MRRTALAVCAIASALSVGAAAAETLLSVHFIDVGYGDAILVDYGVFEALIDGGPDGTCADYIAEHVDGFLEVMVATNPEDGRIGGLDEVLAEFAVAMIYTNGERAETDAYEAFAAAAAAEGSHVTTVRAGDTIALANLHLDVLHPTDLGPDPDANSLVLKLSFEEWDFLFPSRVDSAVEDRLLADGLGRIDVLTVARHGSADATSFSFLKAVRPVACVLSVGPNPYGVPAPEVLDRIGCALDDAVVFRTDVHGTIVLSVTDTGDVEYRTSIAEDPVRSPCPAGFVDPSSEEPPCDCSEDALNCADFPCQPAAQACFEHCLEVAGRDVHGLDADGDGAACEELPRVCP